MDSRDLLYEKRGQLAIATLNRPDKLNALSPGMRQGLAKAILDANSDSEVRVLVVTGAGRGFCSGGDVSNQARRASQSGEDRPSQVREMMDLVEGALSIVGAMRAGAKPTIAAINGVAAGAGLDIALGCDLRVAGRGARLGVPFVKRGLTLDYGGSHFLPRLLGPARALELALTGDLIDAEEAERLGLVNKVVADDELWPAVEELANRIAVNAPLAVQLTKAAVYYGMQHDLAEALATESAYQALCYRTEDHAEGARSFLEKRPAQFRGR